MRMTSHRAVKAMSADNKEGVGGISMTKRLGFLGEPRRAETISTPSVVERINAEVRTRVERVRLLVLDVDGVMTDGRLIYHDDGTESKAFDVRDGHGIKMLKRNKAAESRPS